MLKSNRLFVLAMIITISGRPGSGKSTLAKELAKKLGYRRYSGGDMRGRIAMKMGITIDKLNEIGMKEDWTDKEVDKQIEEIGKSEDNFVFDSWLAWHFIPNSVKIFLDVDLKVGAQRVFANPRPDEERKNSVEEVYDMIYERMEQTRARFKKWYGVDFLDVKNYDFVLDTTNLTIEQSIEKVLEFVKKKTSS